ESGLPQAVLPTFFGSGSRITQSPTSTCSATASFAVLFAAMGVAEVVVVVFDVVVTGGARPGWVPGAGFADVGATVLVEVAVAPCLASATVDSNDEASTETPTIRMPAVTNAPIATISAVFVIRRRLRLGVGLSWPDMGSVT